MSDNKIVIQVTADSDVSRGFGQARAESKKFAADAIRDGASIGSGMGKNMAGGIGTALSGAGSTLGPILAGIGVLAAPMIGAAISGAVVGGAGIGGVAGGLALAARDPRVKAAGADLSRDVMGDLEKRATVFVGPALDGISKIRQGFKDIGPDLDRIFSNSASFVDPLVDGLVSGGRKAVAGFADAVENAGPIIDAFGEAFDKVGGAIGDAFTTLSEHSDEGASAIETITDATVDLIGTTADLIGWLSDMYGKYKDLNGAFIDNVNGMSDWLDKAGFVGDFIRTTNPMIGKLEDSVKGASDETQEMAESMEEAAVAMDFTTEAARGQQSALDELSDEIREQTDPVFALLNAQNKLADAQNDATDAQRKFGRNSPEARSALRKLAEAALDLQSAAGKGADALTGEMSPALRSTLRAAGLTKSQIAGLEGQFRDAKNAGNSFAKTYRANVVTKYTNVGDPMGYANYYAGRAGYAHGGITGAASGGVRDGRMWVGENGPELVDLPPGTNVHPAGTSKAMASRESSGGSGNVAVMVSVAPGAEQGVASAILKMLRFEVRDAGGNVQTLLGTS